MRYYRQSQRSDDVFDSFRRLWLAVENLLDSIEPYVLGRDNEKRWLKRALGNAEKRIGLHRYLPSGLTGSPVDQAYRYFYDGREHISSTLSEPIAVAPT
jgi:hypothetical protein